MNLATLQVMIRRELGAVKREIEAYPDDESVWQSVPGMPNSGGTLALHLAGNLQHFFGAVLGKDGFVRDRDAEFAKRNVPRADLIRGLEAAQRSVDTTVGKLTDADLAKPWPEPLANRRIEAGAFLTHLAVHLSYHLGQLDYHRRAVTRDGRSVDAVSLKELPEAT